MSFNDLAKSMDAELLNNFGVFASTPSGKVLGILETAPSDVFDITTNEPIFIVCNIDSTLLPVGTEITISETLYKIRAKQPLEEHLTNLILSKS